MPPEPRRSDHLLVCAARGEAVERPPVWAMRQAGRWDPEFNRVRAGLSFYEFSENVELAARASLLPRRFGVDGIILFYDITTLPVAMGQPFVLQAGRRPRARPSRPHPGRRRAPRRRARPGALSPHPRSAAPGARRNCDGELPVLVFAGAPFTVATYCIGTGKDMAATRRFAAEQPRVWDALLDRLTTATVDFLRHADPRRGRRLPAVRLLGGMLDARRIPALGAAAARGRSSRRRPGVPRILFVKECPYLERMAQSGADVISLGVRHDLAAARRDYPQLVFQGNVDEELLRTGTPEQVAEATRAAWRPAAAGGTSST